MNGADRPKLPTRAVLHDGSLFLALRDLGPETLLDPFMHRTVARLAGEETFIEIAPDQLGRVPRATAPAGIIFHVGRCGSTTLSQALKQHGDVVVYSEPQPVNELLSIRTHPRPMIVAALRSLSGAFALHAGKRYVFKLSSWNTLHHDLITEAFPDTPWIFSVRDPLEVGEATVRDPSPWFRDDSDAAKYISQLVDPRNEASSNEDFFARMFAAFCDAVAPRDLSRGRLVEYEALRDALANVVVPHFGLSTDQAHIERVLGTLQTYAKGSINNASAFTSDSAAKRAAASGSLREAVNAAAAPALQRVRSAFAKRDR